MSTLLRSLGPLVRALHGQGYRVVGPTVRDGAIVLAELDRADALPYGWGVEAAPGRYRLHRRADAAAFGHAAGPQSWKAFLHPPRSPQWTADRTADGFTVTEAPPDSTRYAFLGVRGCDLRAIAVQDRVLGGADGGYARYLTVPAEYAYRLPTGYPVEELAPLLCAGIIGYRALRRAQSRWERPRGLSCSRSCPPSRRRSISSRRRRPRSPPPQRR